MSWGTPEHGSVRLDVQDVEGMRHGYALAEIYADLVGETVEVDLWDVRLPLDGPLMVQFLVGHPSRSRVVVHDSGVGSYAIGEPAGDGEELSYLRPSGGYTAEPETTVASAVARTVVTDFVRTGRASVRVAWAELPMD